MGKLVVVLVLVASLGCDSRESPEARTAVLEEERPCAVASPEEVAEAVGGAAYGAQAVEARSKDGTMLCSYDVGPPYSTVTLHVETAVSETDFRGRMERDPLNTDPLDGVGDLAFTHAGVGVSVWEDGEAASASLQHFGDPDVTRRALEGLAELIESKL